MSQDYTDEQRDTLTYKAQIPVSKKQADLEKEFQDNAIVGEQGNKETILIRHRRDAENVDSVYVEKCPMSRWVAEINVGGETKEVKLGFFKKLKGAKEAAARFLAESVLDARVHLEHVLEHRLSDTEVIKSDDGQFETSMNNENKSLKKSSLFYEATIPVPQEYQLAYDRFIDTVDRNENSFNMGDHVSGFIHVKHKSNGSWEAVGQGDYDYEKAFEKGMTQDDVIDALARHMASVELDDAVFENHIRRNWLSEDDVEFIQNGDGKNIYERDDPGPG